MQRFFIFVIIPAIVVGMITLGFSTGSVAKEIRIGSVINLTGPVSTFGQLNAKGLEDYIRYVNEVKGGVYGNKIDLTIVDHAYKVPESVKYVKKFCTQDKMDVITTWDAGSGIMAKPIVQKYKIPMFNFSNYQGFLKPPIDYAYLMIGSFTMESHAVLEYIRSIHRGNAAPKVGLLTYNNAFGKAIHQASKDYGAKYNLNIVGIEEFPPKALDLNTELLRLKNRGAEYIFMQILPGSVIMALQAADRIKYDVLFIGTWPITDPDFFKRGKGLIRDRVRMEFTGGLPVDGTPGVQLMQGLMKRYKTVTHVDVSYWFGVALGSVMERAFQRAHEKFGKIERETINLALESFRNEDFGGLLPNVTYTKTDHSASWRARIVKVNEDRTFIPLTGFWAPGKEKVRILKK
jgi:ABC-type branched-subunit amino acid transport system substrate-binding protein